MSGSHLLLLFILADTSPQGQERLARVLGPESPEPPSNTEQDNSPVPLPRRRPLRTVPPSEAFYDFQTGDWSDAAGNPVAIASDEP